MSTMAKSSGVTIVIPAYNEAGSIGRVVSDTHALHPTYEILVVDDGSTDNTAPLAREAGAQVIRHPYNIGNGAAVKTGIRNASGKVIVLMDADGQHDPADIHKLVDHIGQYDMVVGARTKASPV